MKCFNFSNGCRTGWREKVGEGIEEVISLRARQLENEVQKLHFFEVSN